MLTLYNAQQHETLAVMWFFHLRKTGDINTTFYKDLHTLTGFLNYYANGVRLLFASDADGIYFGAWARPIMSLGEFGLWIREDKRHSPSTLKLVYEAYDFAFEAFPTLIGVSKQQHLRKIHEHLGYKFSAEIPHGWDGEPIQFYYLTKEAYHGSRRRNGSIGRGTSSLVNDSAKE